MIQRENAETKIKQVTVTPLKVVYMSELGEICCVRKSECWGKQGRVRMMKQNHQETD